jgi:N-acetylneuraminic acid mutarotase
MKRTRSTTQHAFILILALLGLVGLATFALESVALAQVNPSWIPTGSLNVPRSGHTATLLGNGKVLVVGFAVAGGESAELYDPATGTWSITGSLNKPRWAHTATLLQNGKVLITGGTDDGYFGTALASAEIYDPDTGTWSITGNLNASRSYHTATLLPNGKVLIVGGYTTNLVFVGGVGMASPISLNGAELYDPATGTWSITASLNTNRDSHTATLLPNGKVLVVGGGYWTIDGTTPNDGSYPCGLTLTCSYKKVLNAELYDPATGTWSITGRLNTPRGGHTATLLANGKVLVAGGDSAELYDPTTGTWSITGSLNTGRTNHTATLLSDGKVLIAGGFTRFSTNSAELYDPATGVWSATTDLNTARWGHTATLLRNGKVLVAGGTGASFLAILSSAELYNSHLTAPVDFDGDGKSDIAVYRSGMWYMIRSSDGRQTAVGWGGAPQDKAVPEDYDGDGKTDIAVYRDGMWFIIRSSDGGQTTVDWGGAAQDIPLPADYDGDGKADLAVYRDGVWFILRSSDGGQTTVDWGGVLADVPVPADYDGDGKADVAVYRDGTWFILRSSDGDVRGIAWGGAVQDIPVPGDYDGDGKADLAVYRDGFWFILRSSDGVQTTVGWGLPQDKPVPGDYDGDGKTDQAVYREGTWFILRSSDGDVRGTTWGGAPQDIPLK